MSKVVSIGRKSFVERIFDRFISPRLIVRLSRRGFLFRVLEKKSQNKNILESKRILITRLDHIGDFVMTSSFLREFRANFPEAFITLMVGERVFPLAENCPYVNEVLVFAREPGCGLISFASCRKIYEMARSKLWKRDFDLVVNPRWDSDIHGSSLLAYFSGALRRVGYSECVGGNKKKMNYGFDVFYTDILNGCEEVHEVDRNLNVITFLGGKIQKKNLELWLKEEDFNFADKLLASKGLKEKAPLIVFAPGKHYSKHIWPTPNYVMLGSWLKEEYGAGLIIVGAEEDDVLAENIAGALDGAVNLVGATTITQTAALISKCKLFVGSDSGPKHLAAASDVPVVEVNSFPKNGPSLHVESPDRFKAYSDKSCVVMPEKAVSPCVDHCSAAEAHCIASVKIDDVKQACSKFI